MQLVNSLSLWGYTDIKTVGEKDEPNPSLSLTRNAASPYLSISSEMVSEPQGEPTWDADIGKWKKRMPFCNGADTD